MKGLRKTVLLCAFIALAAGCSRSAVISGDSIRPAELSQEEKDIINLYGGENNSRIFDFAAGEEFNSASVRLKILSPEGQWMDHGRTVLDGSDASSGRILLTTPDEWKSVRMVLQDSSGTNSVSYQTGSDEGFVPGQMAASSWLSEAAAIESGEEIPLLIHVEKNDGTGIETYGTAMFEQPEALAQYDRVFAVTITFSENDSAG